MYTAYRFTCQQLICVIWLHRTLKISRSGQTALLAVKVLDAEIDNEDLDGRTEAVEVRTILEQIQNLSLELSEELDAYQERYLGP